MKRATLMTTASVLAVLGATTVSAASIVNGDFEANEWNSGPAAGTATPTGWTSNLVSGQPGHFGLLGANPNVVGIAAAMQNRGGNFMQTTISGIDPTSAGSIAVTFDYAYRNDAATDGDVTLRFSLFNSTDGVEIVGTDFIVTDPGVPTDPADANQLTGDSLNLAYGAQDPGDVIGLRITHNGSTGGGAAFASTILLDNVAVPEPSSLALLGLGGLMIARRRRG